MSIHAELNDEAKARLAAYRRNSTISSVVISLLTIALILLILGLFFLEPFVKESPTIITYAGSSEVEEKVEKPKVTTQVQRKPSAPSSTMTKVITSNAPSPVTIPVPEITPDVPSVSFGDGQDFGSGWGDGIGEGAGGGGGFGSGSSASGGLEGSLYDLKKDTREKPLPISTDIYNKKLLDIQEGFSKTKLNDYFVAPKTLFLTHLAIPLKDASEGPASFEVQDSMQPTFWMAHYTGTVTVPRSGTYRFSGTGDNYLHVRIDNKTVLHYDREDVIQPRNWKPTTPTQEGHQSPYVQGWIVHYGDWIDLREGQQIKIDIGIGEAGGGKLGFILQLEKKGEKYKTDGANKNRPILPLFTTADFSSEEIKRIRSEFPSYEIDFDKYEVFRIKR